MLSNMIRLHPRLLSISELFSSIESVAFPPGVLDARQFWQILSQPLPVQQWLFGHGLIPDEITYGCRAAAVRFRDPTTIPPIALMTLPHLSDRPDELLDEIASFISTLPPAPIEQHYRRLFEWLCRRFGRETWVERSGGSLDLLPALRVRFPNARFVHLYRDGRETAMSMSRHHLFRIRVILEQLQEWLGPQAFITGVTAQQIEQKIPPAWRGVLPWAFDVEAYRRLELPIEAFAARWSQRIVAGVDELNKLPPDRVLHMRYETILDRPREEVRRLASFIGGEMVDESWINAAAALCRRKSPTWVDLPADVRARVEAACAAGMQKIAQIPPTSC